MRAVDTNVLVRLLIGDNEKQVAAAEGFVENGAWVSHLALAETIWVMESTYERTQAQLTETIELLLDHKYLTLQDPDVVRAALHTYRSRRNVGFTDCMLIEIARRAGHLPLGTFDRDLGKLEGAELVRRQ